MIHSNAYQNYYEIMIPLKVSQGTSREELWPEENEINLPLEALQEIKSKSIAQGSITSLDPTYYDIIREQLSEDPVLEYDPIPSGLGSGDQYHRIGIIGNPNFGDVRTLMIGVKNRSSMDKCAVLWFNELRISDMDSEGGWAATLSVDANVADFVSVSAAGRKSTAGFGTIEQGPEQRSREDVEQYDVVTNVNVGMLLPEKWGLQIPFNYGVGEEKITPRFDEFYRDIELQTQLDNNANKDSILNVNENYTKRKSINFIGVRKIRTGEFKLYM